MLTISTSLQVFELDPNVLYPIDFAARLLEMSRHAILLCCKYGMVSPVIDPATGALYFDEQAIRTLRRVQTLRTLCSGNLTAARMMLDLQDEVGRLQAELRFWRS